MILTVTMNSTVDISMHVDRLLPEGKTRAAVDSVRGGGGGINVARCIARFGGSATALYITSPDVGRRLDHLLEQEDMDRIPMHVNDDIREAIVLLEASTGHSYHIVPPGPWLTPREVDHCRQAILDAAEHAPLLVLSGSMARGVPDDFCYTVLRDARTRGVKVITDLAGAQLRESLRGPAHLVRLDRTEASALIGRPISGFGDARAANDLVLGLGAAEIAVTTVGPLGTVCSTATGHVELPVPALPAPARSDACAGDSLVAALTVRLATGDSPAAACAWGVAAAAATVMRPGTDIFDMSTVRTLHAAVVPHHLVRD